MITPSGPLAAKLVATTSKPVDLYELYLDTGTLYFAEVDITWGGYRYLPYVEGRSEIQRVEGPEFDRVSVTFSNVDLQLVALLLATRVEQRKLIIRKVDRDVAGDSIVLFNGRMDRASRIDEPRAVVDAYELIGSIENEVPGRTFETSCQFPFKGFECGYAGVETDCNRSIRRCVQLGNQAKFGGFRFLPHMGSFQYQTESSERFLLLFRRKKLNYVTAAFNSVDDIPYGSAIPIVLGRAQITGLGIQHADEGAELKAAAALCVGTIESVHWPRANQVAIEDWTAHLGQLGGTASQLVDARFPNGQTYNLVAYIGVTLPSAVAEVDPAPTITAVVMGQVVDFYDAAGAYAGFGWSDSPIWNTIKYLTLPVAQGGMGIDISEIDLVHAYQEAQWCAGGVTDDTGDQQIFLPSSLGEMRLGLDYKRYRSTGVVGADPRVDGPYQAFEPGVSDDTGAVAAVTVKRYTMNVALAKPQKAAEQLWKKLLVSFGGYLRYSQTGKIQICVERPVKQTTMTAASSVGATVLAVAGDAGFVAGELVLVGALTANAEVRTVVSKTSTTLTVTACAKTHASGVVIHLVHMAFDDTNMIGSVEYPLSDRQPSTNRVTVKYVDAAAGFEERTLPVNDFDHQLEVRKVNNEDLDGSAIDNYFQAYRMGQRRLAKVRDLGSFVRLQTDLRGHVLEIGDVVAVTAVECGLVAAPFRLISVGFGADDNVTLLGQAYDIGIYDDVAPRATARIPAVFGAQVATAAAPEVWCPWNERPPVGDPLYPRGDWQFGQVATYQRLADSSLCLLTIYGSAPVNSVLDGAGPVISGVAVATTGGTVKGGRSYYLRVHAQRADKRLSAASNLVRVDVPAGTNTNRITLSVSWPTGTWANAVILGGEDLEVMCAQATPAIAASIVASVAFDRSTWGIPGRRLGYLVARTKRVQHAGVWGALVTAVSSTAITCSDLADPTDNWNGRVFSVLADASDGVAAIWNFQVTAYNQTTGEATVTPDPAAAGVEVGDVAIVCAQVTAVGANYIEDAGFINLHSAGLVEDEERGLIVRVLDGAGRGQLRRIDAVTSGRRLVLDRAWTVVPAVGDHFIVEAAGWEYVAPAMPIANEDPDAQVTITTPVDNFEGQVVIQQVFTVDVDGQESDAEKSPFRMVYLFGSGTPTAGGSLIQIEH
jgi:hypothetical protein